MRTLFKMKSAFAGAARSLVRLHTLENPAAQTEKLPSVQLP